MIKKITLIVLLILLILPFNVRAGDSCSPNCQTEPPCCKDILTKLHELGDVTGLPDDEQPYHQCPWTEDNAATNLRAYCLPSTCYQLPVGLAYRGHCGWYWSYHDPYTKTGYGCMIGPDENHMTPICGGGPTPTARPAPTTAPRLTPTVRPTNKPSPTQIPEPTDPLAAPTHIYPTEEPAVEQQNNTTDYGFASQGFNQDNGNAWNYNPRPIQTSLRLNLPSISLPALHFQGLMINMEKLNQQASKTFDFFEYVFFRIKFYDMKLERGINGSFLRLLRG